MAVEHPRLQLRPLTISDHVFFKSFDSLFRGREAIEPDHVMRKKCSVNRLRELREQPFRPELINVLYDQGAAARLGRDVHLANGIRDRLLIFKTIGIVFVHEYGSGFALFDRLH